MSNNQATPAERALSRANIVTESIKSLILVNGGGAIALLAFLQAVWEKNPSLARLALTGIAFMLAGVTFALIVPFFRVPHSFRAQETEATNPTADSRTWLWWVYMTSTVLSFLSFLGGWGSLVIGAFWLLPA